MIITNRINTDRTFYDLTDSDKQYTVVKTSINQGAIQWMAIVYSPYQDITSTELGQSLIAYCQANP
jgi:hypothetical protein